MGPSIPALPTTQRLLGFPPRFCYQQFFLFPVILPKLHKAMTPTIQVYPALGELGTCTFTHCMSHCKVHVNFYKTQQAPSSLPDRGCCRKVSANQRETGDDDNSFETRHRFKMTR